MAFVSLSACGQCDVLQVLDCLLCFLHGSELHSGLHTAAAIPMRSC